MTQTFQVTATIYRLVYIVVDSKLSRATIYIYFLVSEWVSFYSKFCFRATHNSLPLSSIAFLLSSAENR